MSYQPTPGSIPDRVLAFLDNQPPGAEFMSSRLAECVGIDPGGLSSTLEPAVQAGRLFKRQKDRQHLRSPMFWSLTDHAKAAPAPKASKQAQKAVANGHDPEETHALRAAVPETAKSVAVSGDAQRADDRGPPQGEPPRAEVIAPYCAPPVATSATPDESNRHASPFRCALWSTGTLHIERGAEWLVLSQAETRQLVRYLESVLLEREQAHEQAT